jgi:TatD DNase family protein
MGFIDIGVNLMHQAFDRDREGVLQAAGDAGVSGVVITGGSEQGSRDAARYAVEYNAAHPGGPVRLYATAGVHPHGAAAWGPGTGEALRNLAGGIGPGKERIVRAIGECGLDYNRDFSPRDIQRKRFEEQIALAVDLKLPLFLHERDAFSDFSAILENSRSGISAMVAHCFTGTERELARYLDLGCYIGLTGWICDERRGGHLAGLVGKIPPDRLLIETDAPYLIPRDLPKKPARSGRNEPRYLPHIAAVIAGHLRRPVEELAVQWEENTRRFFGLEGA